MPPKRKKSVRQKQKQRQSQSQKVIVNIGKTTTTKRRRNAGRGGLAPPSHLQNLAPTFVTAPQVDYVGLIGEISRLTAKVQDPVPIRNPVTPLQATLQATNAEAQQMAGIKAEERRAGPTAENFQPPPSRARSLSQDLEGFETYSVNTPSQKSVSGSSSSGSTLVVSPDSSVVRQQELNTRSSLQFINDFNPDTVVRPTTPSERLARNPRIVLSQSQMLEEQGLKKEPMGDKLRRRAKEQGITPPPKPRERSPAPPRKPQRRKSRDSI